MKQVTAILLGAGQRGAEAYASYALVCKITRSSKRKCRGF